MSSRAAVWKRLTFYGVSAAVVVLELVVVVVVVVAVAAWEAV